MTRRQGLGGQILRSMITVVVGVSVVVMVCLYAFYALLFLYNPAPPQPDSADYWTPEWSEWIFMGAMVILSAAIAVVFATRLTRRLLTPLNSVADAVRRVAHGDLAARALAGDRALGETAALVDDFNSMAERLQRTALELNIWNAAIAHELRTPVTILRGRLQGLAEGVFVPDEAQFRSLLGQVENLSRLIDDLRVLSLADSGHLALRRAPVDLARELADLLALLAPGFSAAGSRLTSDLFPGTVVCDIIRVRQVVQALLDNARRYAQPGTVRVTTVRDGSAVRLQVEDDGPGLGDELAGNVFAAFNRGNDSRSRASGGSGLGLAVVRAIAEAHGGAASYRRNRRGGASFEVVLHCP
ncbi:histidine kinase [Duganella sp. Leaf126]|uniref:ATP-binding protein n=1 Tax=Duganella sp. Leaf126 TaxID=1736266 RepID=UPI000700875E|nr:ATP-binding protein [Duganella sp. Leaf126]KQQ35985.1 histidine kinase [Duganella sp. Leaf126]